MFNINIHRFNINEDKDKITEFLTDCYRENENMSCWLPARFEDLIYRIDTLYVEERGGKANKDFIYYWECNHEVVALILPDGASFNTSIKQGYEYLFKEMLDLGEEKLRHLFKKDENNFIDFLVVSHDSLEYQTNELIKRGYVKQEDEDYDNAQKPSEKNYMLDLPTGYRQIYGDELDENRKINACHYGFHPECDDGNLDGEPQEGKLAYNGRKKSSFNKDSFESLIITESGDICSYCFCYVDKKTSTAFIEPVCTREKYRMKGLCKQMLQGVIIKLKEVGINKAFINSYAWRKKVYNSAGFMTEDSIGFWKRKMHMGTSFVCA